MEKIDFTTEALDDERMLSMNAASLVVELAASAVFPSRRSSSGTFDSFVD